MTAKTETPINDDELDALMAELEASTAGAIEVPKVVAKPVLPAEPEPEPVAVERHEPVTVVAAEPEPVAAEPEPIPAPAPERVAIKPVLVIVPVTDEPAPAQVAEEAAEAAPKAKGVNLQFHIDVAEFRKETAVSDVQLDKCMIEQNGLRAYYGEQAARSEAQAARIKLRFEHAEATLYDRHRKALVLVGEKTTEKMIETAVKLDPLWMRAKNLLIEAETIAAVNKSLVESLKDRKDMLIQLGADRREEGKGQTRIMAQKDADADLRDRASSAARR